MKKNKTVIKKNHKNLGKLRILNFFYMFQKLGKVKKSIIKAKKLCTFKVILTKHTFKVALQHLLNVILYY